MTYREGLHILSNLLAFILVFLVFNKIILLRRTMLDSLSERINSIPVLSLLLIVLIDEIT